MAGDRAAARPRLITPTFALITGSALAYFIALGVLTPALPTYVEDELGGGGAAVGVAVGAFAVSAALLRPVVGRIGDRRGRRILVVGGSLVAGSSVLLYGVVESLAWLVAMRLLTGVGEAAMFVGAATAAQDLAPPERRGEATSYFSVAVYGGLAVGPIVGDAVREWSSPGTVWAVAAAWCLLAAGLGIWVPPGARRPPPEDEIRRWLQPDALRPGVVLALAMIGFAGFSAFVPVYVDDIGLARSGPVFAVYATLVLVIRIVGARLPDRLGTIRASSMALAVQAAGLVLMGAWGSIEGLFTATVVYSIGVSLLFPALFPLVVDAAPEAERSHAVATFTLFFDLSQGVGALFLGWVVALSSERVAFAVAGGLSLVALAVLRSGPTVPAARERL